jgi:hypothetical protein
LMRSHLFDVATERPEESILEGVIAVGHFVEEQEQEAKK